MIILEIYIIFKIMFLIISLTIFNIMIKSKKKIKNKYYILSGLKNKILKMIYIIMIQRQVKIALIQNDLILNK